MDFKRTLLYDVCKDSPLYPNVSDWFSSLSDYDKGNSDVVLCQLLKDYALGECYIELFKLAVGAEEKAWEELNKECEMYPDLIID